VLVKTGARCNLLPIVRHAQLKGNGFEQFARRLTDDGRAVDDDVAACRSLGSADERRAVTAGGDVPVHVDDLFALGGRRRPIHTDGLRKTMARSHGRHQRHEQCKNQQNARMHPERCVYRWVVVTCCPGGSMRLFQRAELTGR